MPRWRTASRIDTDLLNLLQDDEEDELCDDDDGPIVLRDYQQEAIDACTQALKDGHTRIAVSSPTGSGKTITFVSLIEHVPVLRRGSDQSIVIVHSLELAKQVRDTILRVRGRRCSVGLEQGAQRAYGCEEIIVATWQSLKNPNRLIKYNPARFKLVIVDEAHHASAESYLYILHHFNDGVNFDEGIIGLGPRKHGHHVPIVGFSATLVRDDERPLIWAFEKIVHHLSVQELLERSFLCRVQFITVFRQFERMYDAWAPDVGRLGPDGTYERPISVYDEDENELESSDSEDEEEKDKQKKTTAKFARTPEFNVLVVKTYTLQAQDRKSTLVFCASLACVDVVLAAFGKAGYKAHAISSRTPDEERKRIMRDFKRGKFPVLVNCLVLTEGADMPAVDCVLLARPTKSRVYFSQMVGRGMRLSPGTGKDGCLIVDFFGTFGEFGLAVEPSLV